jgi:hypothetical protein
MDRRTQQAARRSAQLNARAAAQARATARSSRGRAPVSRRPVPTNSRQANTAARAAQNRRPVPVKPAYVSRRPVPTTTRQANVAARAAQNRAAAEQRRRHNARLASRQQVAAANQNTEPNKSSWGRETFHPTYASQYRGSIAHLRMPPRSTQLGEFSQPNYSESMRSMPYREDFTAIGNQLMALSLAETSENYTTCGIDSF